MIENISKKYEKQKKLKEQAKLMSAQRARVGASGAQFSGSPLLIANADFEEFENDMFFLEKNSNVYHLGYPLRDAFIDYIINEEKIESKVDNRFIINE